MFNRKRILIVGSGRIACKAAEELVAAERPGLRVDELEQAASRLRSGLALIVADPIVDSAALVRQVAALCRRRSSHRPPLRLILVRDEGDSATGTPDVPEGANLSLETFAPQEQAARSLLARWPPHTGMDPPHDQVPHILIAGFAAPASALLAQTMRLIHYGDQTPVITLADEDPPARRAWLMETYPQAGQLCQLRIAEIDDIDLSGVPPVTGAFVCMALPEQGLATARRIAARIAGAQGASPLIYLEIGDTAPAGEPGDWDGQLVPFSWLHEACKPEVLLDGRGDAVARVIHAHYRDSIAAQGRDPDAEPAGRCWDNLDASYRDASRHQADHMTAKLAVLDCRAVREELVESFTFAPLEAERLAMIEHTRWAADRYIDGWTFASARDNARKHHPQLIPYEDLSEPMKDLDRFAVRLVPTLFARLGRGLVRMLLVAVAEPRGDSRGDHKLLLLADKALQRLRRRYPDRSLVLASTLESEKSRLVVRRALDDFEIGLFLLCPRPLPETVAAQPGNPARRDLLELAARAERRIALAGEEGLQAWLGQRAEITMLLGIEAKVSAVTKQVMLDSGTGQMTWSFEY